MRRNGTITLGIVAVAPWPAVGHGTKLLGFPGTDLVAYGDQLVHVPQGSTGECWFPTTLVGSSSPDQVCVKRGHKIVLDGRVADAPREPLTELSMYGPTHARYAVILAATQSGGHSVVIAFGSEQVCRQPESSVQPVLAGRRLPGISTNARNMSYGPDCDTTFGECGDCPLTGYEAWHVCNVPARPHEGPHRCDCGATGEQRY